MRLERSPLYRKQRVHKEKARQSALCLAAVPSVVLANRINPSPRGRIRSIAASANIPAGKRFAARMN